MVCWWTVSVVWAVAEVGVGASLVAQFGHYTAALTQAPQAPNLSLGDLRSHHGSRRYLELAGGGVEAQ